jgi:hypothetical protein
MVHRIALVGGAVAATGILALALGQGILFARSQQTTDPAAQSAPSPAPTPRTQIDTVYVKPAPPQQVIHLTQTSHPTTARQTPRVVVVNHPPHGGDNDGEGRGDGGSERGGD